MGPKGASCADLGRGRPPARAGAAHCLHQQVPLNEIARPPGSALWELVEDYQRHKRDARRQDHADVEGRSRRKDEVEKARPINSDTKDSITVAECLDKRADTDETASRTEEESGEFSGQRGSARRGTAETAITRDKAEKPVCRDI